MPRILVLGATGMLGVEASQFLKSSGYDVINHGFSKNADVCADLTNLAEANQLLINCKPDVIVNMTGFTSVENCEANIEQAYLVNTKIVENMVGLVGEAKKDIYLVQISTISIFCILDKALINWHSLILIYFFSFLFSIKQKK